LGAIGPSDVRSRIHSPAAGDNSGEPAEGPRLKCVGRADDHPVLAVQDCFRAIDGFCWIGNGHPARKSILDFPRQYIVGSCSIWLWWHGPYHSASAGQPAPTIEVASVEAVSRALTHKCIARGYSAGVSDDSERPAWGVIIETRPEGMPSPPWN
jgi:hypothetical protein